MGWSWVPVVPSPKFQEVAVMAWPSGTAYSASKKAVENDWENPKDTSQDCAERVHRAVRPSRVRIRLRGKGISGVLVVRTKPGRNLPLIFEILSLDVLDEYVVTILRIWQIGCGKEWFQGLRVCQKTRSL